jgi:glycosyltransferase involved in cell wall biosynthesis
MPKLVPSRTLRLAFIAPFGLRPKGTASARALPLAQALVARGHQVRLVVPPWDDPSAPPQGRVSCLGGVEVVELPAPRPALSGAGVIGWPAALVREALRGRPDVVHVFKPKAYAGFAALGLAALRRPWVLDTDDWEGRGGWNALNRYPAPQRALFQWQETTLPRLAGAATVASRTLETQLWGFGVPRRRVFYLPNGVDHAKYDPWLAAAADPAAVERVRGMYGLPPASPDNPLLLLWTRFVEFPMEWPLRVLEALAPHTPGLRLLIVGEGFHGEERRLLAEADARGLAGRVLVCGRVEGADLGGLLAQGTVALYPMRDTLVNRAKCPVKLLDLLALGVPVVAHNVGQVGEYLGHGESGVLVPPGDVPGLTAGVQALLADPARRRTLGQAAAARAWTCFPWSRLAAAAEAAYAVALRRMGG